MKHIAGAVFVIGLACMAGQVSADDTNSDRPVKPHRQLMKECIARHRSQDSSASQDDLKKACSEELKSYQDHPSSTSAAKSPPT